MVCYVTGLEGCVAQEGSEEGQIDRAVSASIPRVFVSPSPGRDVSFLLQCKVGLELFELKHSQILLQLKVI
jgi:hypothetical protein